MASSVNKEIMAKVQCKYWLILRKCLELCLQHKRIQNKKPSLIGSCEDYTAWFKKILSFSYLALRPKKILCFKILKVSLPVII